MSRALITESYLTGIADAIRSKTGAATTYRPGDMAAAIQAIPTGITPTGTLEITENGTYDVTQYASVSINVSGGGGSVTIVPWATGTDEEIAAMIDAAHAGVIDLQTDGGWAVGDVRTIHVDAFTGGGNVSHAAQNIQIVITSFEEYMSSGNVMQFDFKNTITNYQRMNSTDSNSGGYGGSEMKLTTLPALVNALPQWLRSRLIEFSVLASAGQRSSDIVTVSGNKLALRSEVEIAGTNTYSFQGEGEQLNYYTNSDNRKRTLSYWTRSPHKNANDRYVAMSSTGNATSAYASSISASSIAPFGCL